MREGKSMNAEIVDHTVWHQENRGNYELSIVARLKGVARAPKVTLVNHLNLSYLSSSSFECSVNLCGGIAELAVSQSRYLVMQYSWEAKSL